jgi:lipoyl-dependent peroxiredoxin
MAIRKANATWEGGLKSGKGNVKSESGAISTGYSFSSRFEDGKGTNPEELLGAAHAGCYSMALSGALEQAGFKPNSVHTIANVKIEKVGDGFSITNITLETEADIPGISADQFQEQAEGAKKNCPVSKALSAVNIDLKARLK